MPSPPAVAPAVNNSGRGRSFQVYTLSVVVFSSADAALLRAVMTVGPQSLAKQAPPRDCFHVPPIAQTSALAQHLCSLHFFGISSGQLRPHLATLFWKRSVFALATSSFSSTRRHHNTVSRIDICASSRGSLPGFGHCDCDMR